jgi:hypothetical protein
VIVIVTAESKPSGEEEIEGSCSLLPKTTAKNETTVPAAPHPGLKLNVVSTGPGNAVGGKDNASTRARIATARTLNDLMTQTF